MYKSDDSFYFHDYETFGIDPKVSRASQFAGIRTDLDLNILPDGQNDVLNIYCENTNDYLPSPEACLVTGHTPQMIEDIKNSEKALSWDEKTALSEYEFSRKIHTVLSKSGTCGIGYNNISFDDEFSRNIFYRTLKDPYQREWQKGCSRTDGLNFVRFAYLNSPNIINFPDKIFEDGEKRYCENGETVKSFRLEDLSKANGIDHLDAHDALSDVYALIGILKLIKDRKPELFDYVYNNRRKKDVLNFINVNCEKPLVHVSPFYGSSNHSLGIVKMISANLSNPNSYIFVNLLGNVELLKDLSAEDLESQLFMKKSELEDLGKERPPISNIEINKCPVVSDLDWIKNNINYLGIDGNLIRKNLKFINDNIDEIQYKISIIFQKQDFPPCEDVDLGIYSGFASNHDRNIMNQINVDLLRGEFSGQDYNFYDEKFKKLYKRFVARNFPNYLGVKETTVWERFQKERVTGKRFDDNVSDPVYCKFFGEYTLIDYIERINELLIENKDNSRNKEILLRLYNYGKNLVPDHPIFKN